MTFTSRHGALTKNSDALLRATWIAWSKMKERCLNPNHKFYADYGGRGITICDRWLVFENFLEDMGVRPSIDYTLERKDNSGNYRPGNVRWATRLEQGANKRNNRLLTFNNETHHVAEWERRAGLPKDTISDRLRRGMPIERVLEPLHGKARAQ